MWHCHARFTLHRHAWDFCKCGREIEWGRYGWWNSKRDLQAWEGRCQWYVRLAGRNTLKSLSSSRNRTMPDRLPMHVFNTQHCELGLRPEPQEKYLFCTLTFGGCFSYFESWRWHSDIPRDSPIKSAWIAAGTLVELRSARFLVIIDATSRSSVYTLIQIVGIKESCIYREFQSTSMYKSYRPQSRLNSKTTST